MHGEFDVLTILGMKTNRASNGHEYDIDGDDRSRLSDSRQTEVAASSKGLPSEVCSAPSAIPSHPALKTLVYP